MHIEDVKDGQRFLKTAKEVTRKKPVLILKPGKTKEAKKALRSHTGALAGEDQVYDAAFKQAGIIRVETLEELLDLAKIFALQPLPRGNRVAIITTTGGVGILAIDTALECGLTMAELCEDSTKKLNEIFPMLGKNPIDIIPALLAFEDISLFYREAVTIALSDEGVDCASVVLYEAPITVLQQRSRIVEVFSELKKFGKPITVWLYGTSLPLIRELAVCLEDSGIPVYFDFVTAVKALGVAAKYSNLIFLKSR
jgi:acetyltransferase